MDRFSEKRLAEVSVGRAPCHRAGDDDAQLGLEHPAAKALKGFGGRGVLEIVDDFDGDTYRAVYTVKFAGIVYVLHALQKKSKKGIATPQREIDLIKARLKRAEEHYRENFVKGTKP
jgi:phage-related protein